MLQEFLRLLFQIPSTIRTFGQSFIPGEQAITLSDLSDIMALGVGLYLALGIEQAVSAGGIAGIRRRADSLQRTIGRAKISAEFSSVRSLQLDIGRIEIGFESLNRSILWLVTVLFLLGLPALVAAAFAGELAIGSIWATVIVAYYVVAPCLIYMISSLIISSRCKSVMTAIKQTEGRVKKSLLQL